LNFNPTIGLRILGAFSLAPILITLLVSGQAPKVDPNAAARNSGMHAAPTSDEGSHLVPQVADRKDLEAFLDGLIPLQLQQQDIAGAAVSVVKDGKVILAKGYGFADVKARKPVTPDGTLFRPGSISKTFTWTAVMQLVEQGKLDLDRDVNDYLDFQIPATFGKPITMRNIMTHTSGLAEGLKDIFTNDPADLRPLSQWLPSHLPDQIFPPGTTPAYSNYATSVAGYIVERTSGMPFNDYIDKNILQPLAMSHSTFAQPLPDNLKPLLSQGYARASGPAHGFEIAQIWPAGSLSTTAEDMTHYMLAHLQNGEYNGARILKPETSQLMHSRLFGLLPELNGMAYGFIEESRNGRRIIGHGGDTIWFHSDMHLMLDDYLGFFVSYNSAGKGEYSPRTALWEQLLDRYFPFTPPVAEQLASAPQDAKSVAGTYMISRREQGTIMSLFWMLAQGHVKANSDGTISDNQADLAGNPKRFQEIAPFMFREVNGQDHIAFKKDDEGRLIMITDVPIAIGEPASLQKSSTFNLAVLAYALGMFALSLLFWPVIGMLRRHYGWKPQLTPGYRRLRLVLRLISILNLAFIGFWLYLFSSVVENLALFSSHSDGVFHLFQVIGVVGAVGSLVGLYYCIRSWFDRSLWLWTRLWNTLLMLAFAGYAWFLMNWHLLNFHLNY
jgi:CubicO group peptidase (beta-lactamase class C family)